MKFLKVGRVAIITRGRYAGKKVSCSETESGEEVEGSDFDFTSNLDVQRLQTPPNDEFPRLDGD
jgi:hypothetical protein